MYDIIMGDLTQNALFKSIKYTHKIYNIKNEL